MKQTITKQYEQYFLKIKFIVMNVWAQESLKIGDAGKIVIILRSKDYFNLVIVPPIIHDNVSMETTTFMKICANHVKKVIWIQKNHKCYM
jgi:hypothetical protein